MALASPAMSRLIAIMLSAVFAASRATAEPAAPPQLQPASICEENQACLALWWREYRAGIAEEFAFWRGFENDVADGGDIRANAILGFAIAQKQYRHHSWDFRGQAFSGASSDDIDAVTSSCRDAVIGIKFLLIAVSDGRQPAQDEVADYLKDARICEKALRLGPFASRLRG